MFVKIGTCLDFWSDAIMLDKTRGLEKNRAPKVRAKKFALHILDRCYALPSIYNRDIDQYNYGVIRSSLVIDVSCPRHQIEPQAGLRFTSRCIACESWAVVAERFSSRHGHCGQGPNNDSGCCSGPLHYAQWHKSVNIRLYYSCRDCWINSDSQFSYYM